MSDNNVTEKKHTCGECINAVTCRYTMITLLRCAAQASHPIILFDDPACPAFRAKEETK